MKGSVTTAFSFLELRTSSITRVPDQFWLMSLSGGISGKIVHYLLVAEGFQALWLFPLDFV